MIQRLPVLGSAQRSPREAGLGSRRAVLLGPIQQENLALQYLAAAARRAGHEVELVPYSYRSDLDAAVTQTLAYAPHLVGLGIAFQNNIDDYIVFMQELRRRGFRGHLTCGGHVPTFCTRELLSDLPELDSVVRHDGESTLVEMLDALALGEQPRDIAGLVWREGSELLWGPVRPAVRDLDSLQWPERSSEPYTVGGLVVDFVVTARGCVGECNYCSIAAYTSEQQKRYRLRQPEAVAEEIAHQYRERGARVVFVQDDLFVLPSAARTAERTQKLKSSLSERGVEDVVFWVKGRPETITPEVCRALGDMGVIHLFLGVESASRERLEYLGRTHQPSHNASAIAACRGAGIVPSFNFMLFDPDCSLDDLEATLELAEAHTDLPWNVCRTEVYSGTALREQLEAEGRLEGNYRSFGYRMKDDRAEVLFRIMRVSLHERALAIQSLLNRLISLSFARQLHEHFFPGSATDQLARASVELSVQARTDTVRALREAMAFVRNENVRDSRAVQRFAIAQALAVNEQDREWRRHTEELWQHFSLRGATLMAKRGLVTPIRARSGFGVAASS